MLRPKVRKSGRVQETPAYAQDLVLCQAADERDCQVQPLDVVTSLAVVWYRCPQQSVNFLASEPVLPQQPCARRGVRPETRC